MENIIITIDAQALIDLFCNSKTPNYQQKVDMDGGRTSDYYLCLDALEQDAEDFLTSFSVWNFEADDIISFEDLALAYFNKFDIKVPQGDN